MCLGLILSLVSALQIGQQSILSELSEQLSPTQLFLASAAFPLGKFSSTVFLALRPLEPRGALIVDAWLLITGAIVAAVPFTLFLCLGRFLMGCGAGIGFVCSTVLLFEMIPYPRRPAHFFVMGIAFALATLVVNLLPLLLHNFDHVILFASIFTAACGVAYLLLAPAAPSSSHPSSPSECHSEDSTTSSRFPAALIYALMVLNVSIGVPIILGFSSLLFEELGASYTQASILSLVFPAAQILLILTMYCTTLNRRILVLGGYGVSVFIQAILQLTAVYPFLPQNHSTYAKCFLLWLLAVVSSVPCNTALCLIAEQFTDTNQQTRNISKGRAVMWILSAMSTASFVPSMRSLGFAWSFLPYLLVSSACLLLIVRIYPEDERKPAITP